MYLANGTYNNIIEEFNISSNDVYEPTSDKVYGIGPTPDKVYINIDESCKYVNDKVESLKIGSSIHKNIRTYIRPYLKPGLKLSTLANLIENKCKELTKENGILNGIGFPSSLSVNDCAAHFTPSKLYDVTLNKDSILKIDFGVDINGWITDSAFTIAFDDKYSELLKAVKDATNTGINNAGIDVNIKQWGKDIMEVMESYEVTLNGKTYPIHAIKNLGGHNILKNKIHGGIFLPAAYISYYPNNLRFKEGVYAIETFGSTKSNVVKEKHDENTIYMNKILNTNKISKNKELSTFYSKLLNQYSTMPYCNRYLDKIYNNNIYISNINKLIKEDLISKYPPLHCINGGMTAQYEHTIYLGDDYGKTNKIIFSESNDY